MLIVSFKRKYKVSGALQKQSNSVVKVRKRFRAVSVLNTTYKPLPVDLYEIHMCICRDYLRLIRTPVHLHVLFNVDFHVYDIIRENCAVFDLAIMNGNAAV